MTREALADAFDKAAEALGQLADELRGADPPAAGVVPPSAPAPAAPLPPKRQAPDTSAFTECPAHRKAWIDGKFGPYCTGQESEGVAHDGNWYNDKGYCRITPRSAGAWLKQHLKGAPAPAPQDVDDIPF